MDPPFLEQVAALKHDLAKYVAWRSANLDDRSWEQGSPELIEALRADLLHTRTRDGEPEAAWQVWERFRSELPEPHPPELERVARAVEVLREAEPALRAGELPEYPGRLRGAQREIRAQLRDLHRRLLGRG